MNKLWSNKKPYDLSRIKYNTLISLSKIVDVYSILIDNEFINQERNS